MDWLSRAADDPHACRALWTESPDALQLVATGRLFDVVAMPWGLGLTVLGQLYHGKRCMAGAVVVNQRREKLGFLVGPGAHLVWPDLLASAGGDPTAATCSGRDGYLLAPGPFFAPDAPCWWQRGPVGDAGDLTNLQNLADAVAAVGRLVSLSDAYVTSVVGASGER
ncbi:hypothetical protein LO772_12235 [Yinghuangia sp. ASG 101]|uniref:hypothetical protein n=1 Tax=Yinghuangia sp. ASG 101 TaxID=2896848 RepID=UPI001E628C6C|nr:hypothetical protein [Yinghuangia sp. ASG 101]UGQ14284.1 hypothetical protein LO772_12235 [Yinghuangia sp. ASG 101]